MNRLQSKFTWVTLLGACLLAACNNEQMTRESNQNDTVPDEVNIEAATADTMAALLNEIRATAGVARAENPDQCKLLPVGQRPCGGPERFILYSTAVADEAKLNDLAQRYNAMAAQRNEEEGLMGTCEFLPARLTFAVACV